MNELIRPPSSGLPRSRPMPGTTRAGDGLPRRRWTVHELDQMLEAGIIRSGERFELIGGDLVAMAARGRQHELLKIALNALWMRIRPDDIMVAPETSFRLADDQQPEPEFIVYPRAILAPDVRGDTVLLVVEIADSSLAHDLNVKAPIYASFGVREYWVINTRRQVTTVHRQPTPQGYASRVETAADQLLVPLLAPALALRLDDLETG